MFMLGREAVTYVTRFFTIAHDEVHHVTCTTYAVAFEPSEVDSFRLVCFLLSIRWVFKHLFAISVDAYCVSQTGPFDRSVHFVNRFAD